MAEQDRIGVLGMEEEGGGVRSGPGAARTILRFYIISARPSKQPLMLRTFLKGTRAASAGASTAL